MRKFRISEISAVDRPAQAHASVRIIKRDDSGDAEMEPLTVEARRARRRRLFAEAEAAREAASRRGREIERDYLSEATKMDTRRIDINDICKTSNARLLDELVADEVAKGCTLYSQADRLRMLNSVLAFGLTGGKRDSQFAKFFTAPEGVAYRRWMSLPVHEDCAADVFKADSAALGLRTAKAISTGSPDRSISDVGRPADARLPRQVGGRDATNVNDGQEAVGGTKALVDQAMAIRPWLTIAQAIAYVENMQAEAERVGRQRQSTRYGGADLLARAERPRPWAPASSSGRI
jgi:hypothetical protein